MSRKNLGKASEAAANKFFSNQSEEVSDQQTETEQPNNTNNTEYYNADNQTDVTNNASNINNIKYTNVTNKSKHYDERGKRELRHGLLLDKKLKEDLTLLCYATGNRSINDYIVSLLIEHTEQPENQKLLNDYRNLNRG